MTQTEKERLAISPQYLAGAIDADGCINLVRMKRSRPGGGPRHELRLQYTNTCFEILDLLQEQYGGYVEKATRGLKPNWKPRGNWKTQGANAEEVIRLIYPYLVIKRDRANLALRFRKTFKGTKRGQGMTLDEAIYAVRDSFYEEMMKLNRKGVEVKK